MHVYRVKQLASDSLRITRSEPGARPSSVKLHRLGEDHPGETRTSRDGLVRLHQWRLTDPGFRVSHTDFTDPRVVAAYVESAGHVLADPRVPSTIHSYSPPPRHWGDDTRVVQAAAFRLRDPAPVSHMLEVAARTLAITPPGWWGASVDVGIAAVAFFLERAAGARDGLDALRVPEDVDDDIRPTLAALRTGDLSQITANPTAAAVEFGRLEATIMRAHRFTSDGWETAVDAANNRRDELAALLANN